MGYVGSVLVKQLRQQEPDAYLIGYDLGIFSHCLSSYCQIPESFLDIQYFGDVRSFDQKVLDGCDGVVYLAAISNDPMGKMYESLTDEVNCRSCIRWAEAAKEAGVEITGFIRLEVGEGIEKKEEDFAAEVAKAAQG